MLHLGVDAEGLAEEESPSELPEALQALIQLMCRCCHLNRYRVALSSLSPPALVLILLRAVALFFSFFGLPGFELAEQRNVV